MKKNTGDAASQGGNSRADASNGRSRRRRRSQTYKHVDYQKPARPSLSNEQERRERREQGAAKGSAKKAPAADGAQKRKRKVAAPKRDDKSTLKVIPLGGLDAIGKNMTVFECGDDIILDDAGLMFPDDDHPGVDLILPDYTYLLENSHKLRGILITHGHEDHTGSLPYLLKDLDRNVPIYGTKLTLGLIEGKLAEHRIKGVKLVEVKPGQRLKLGCFTCDFFSVNHSIPGAMGIFFQSPAGTVLHTGDFKLDQTPIDGVCTDFAALSRFGEVGVDLMMSDSTNANVPAFTPSEAEVGQAMREIISQATGRVIIASFASHIHRMQQICDAAVASGRKVVVTGRSMVQNTDIARRLGYLNVRDSDIIDAYELKGVSPDKLVVMCTGSQGEPLSALSRIASGEHKTIQLDEGDTVIISATPVPGNEKAVTRIINLLAKVGADVYDKRRARVHVSGHAGAEELKIVLSMVKPRHFMPVHGEAEHLRAHARLAQATGVPRSNIFVLDNGESLEVSAKGVVRGEPVPSGIVLVDGLSVGDTSQDVLDERNVLSEQGFAAIAVAIDRSSRSVVGEVAVQMHGIPGSDDENLCQEAKDTVASALTKSLGDKAKKSDLEKACTKALQSLLWSRVKQRPMIIVNLLVL